MHSIPWFDPNILEVAIPRGVTVAMVDGNQAAVLGFLAGNDDHSVRGGHNRGSRGGRNIDSLVGPCSPGGRAEAGFPESRGDPPDDRPEGRNREENGFLGKQRVFQFFQVLFPLEGFFGEFQEIQVKPADRLGPLFFQDRYFLSPEGRGVMLGFGRFRSFGGLSRQAGWRGNLLYLFLFLQLLSIFP